MRLFRIAIASISICFPAWPQDADVAILFSIPPQVEKVFKKSNLAKSHVFSSHVNPYYLHGDFNGDGKFDTAVLIKEKATGKVGIAIFHGGSTKVIRLGGGAIFGDSKASNADDFAWLDAWYIYLRGPVGRGVGEDPPPKLIGDGLLVQKSESASGLIFWNGKRYVWYQQGD